MTEKEKIEFHRLIDYIIFNYDPSFEEDEQKRDEIFKKALDFIGGTMEKDLFLKELNSSLKPDIYKEEFKSVGKTLLRWLEK